MFVNTPVSPLQPKEFKAILDNTLRPKTWPHYIGQEKVKKTVQIMIEAAQKRNEVLDHLLFYGNPGLGKTTLSYIIAKEMNVNIHVTSGPALRKSGDLASILSSLSEGDILFIDEIHRLNKICEELIYPAMEDFKIDIVVGKGPMAQSMEINLPHFTLVGATTKAALLSPPLRSRFGGVFQLNAYTQDELEGILEISATTLNIKIDKPAKTIIAQCARCTPRIANHLLKRVRDFAQVKGLETINQEITQEALNFLEIDSLGLGPEDKKILSILIKNFQGGPVGIKTLAAASTEEEDSILDIYEPYLMQLGFLERTPKGRRATLAAYKYLGLTEQYRNTLI